ncbi:hypothetical protein [Kaistia granuli]|uniref:hypothetical protein n=1 Tax=Kaistia granuli TaxID=363259 RepID=UPI0003A42712|nr:hypothetical protein [Kaistia granuli]
MVAEPKEDITIRLAIAALDPESVEPGDMEALLRETIVVIGVLRAAARLRTEIEADVQAEIGQSDIEPEGSA